MQRNFRDWWKEVGFLYLLAIAIIALIYFMLEQLLPADQIEQPALHRGEMNNSPIGTIERIPLYSSKEIGNALEHCALVKLAKPCISYHKDK
jgi:uncharacterized protein YpmS